MPLASIGVYSAGLKRRDTDSQVIVAGIQSISRHAYDLGAVDLILIDEAHLVPHSDDGMYRKFVQACRLQNPAVRFIGLTATPYRLGSGLLHRGKNPLFTEIAYDAPVRDLINAGYLCRLISKATLTRLNTAGVATRGGEFVPGQLEAAVDVADTTAAVVREVQTCAEPRRKVLVFCAGITHAEHVADAFTEAGWQAAAVHGELGALDRADRLEQFKAGMLRVLTSVDVLTTGYDEPSIDCIVMLRPTKSTGLYVQMVGRGFRLHPSKQDTLVLDFAGNVARHGPVDAIEVKEAAPSEGTAPTKECPGCREIILAALRVCPQCGHEFPKPELPPILPTASLAPVLSDEALPTTWEDVTDVQYCYHEPKAPKTTPTLRVDYYAGHRRIASEWICLEHQGFARVKAERWWSARHPEAAPATITDALDLVAELRRPLAIGTKPDGRYIRVAEYRFEQPKAAGLPRACWSCGRFAPATSFCLKWEATPPADVQITGCPAWTDEEDLPF
jgi:DNA repair protein RadD